MVIIEEIMMIAIIEEMMHTRIAIWKQVSSRKHEVGKFKAAFNLFRAFSLLSTGLEQWSFSFDFLMYVYF